MITLHDGTLYYGEKYAYVYQQTDRGYTFIYSLVLNKKTKPKKVDIR